MQPWRLGHRFSPEAAQLADRHYNRQTIGSPQFCPPGSPLVLLTEPADAVWVSLVQKHSDHLWPGAVTNTLFRREPTSPYLASDLIRAAVAATRSWLGEVPEAGLITFVDATAVRHKRDPGRCYLKAGFVKVGVSRARGRLVFKLHPPDWPEAEAAVGTQGVLL